jgi:hypothetical protein
VVDALEAVAVLELLADDTGLHCADPRLADVLLTLLEGLCWGNSVKCRSRRGSWREDKRLRRVGAIGLLSTCRRRAKVAG